MSEDPRDVRIRELEDALAAIAHQARAARHALCEQELLVRLENIARRAAAAIGLPPPGEDEGHRPGNVVDSPSTPRM